VKLAAWFAGSLALLWTATTLAATGACPSAASVPAPPPEARGAQPPQVSVGGEQTLLIGDSIAARWVPSVGSDIFNFGHGGDRTQWMLWRLQNAAFPTGKFRNAIVIAGTNNSGPHFTGCQIAGGVLALVQQLKILSIPNIVVVSLLPRGVDFSQNEDNIVATNTILRDSAAEAGYRFVDVYSRFRDVCDHHSPCTLYLPGLIHPTADGYKIFDETIKPLLR